MNRYLAELFGTFILVALGVGSIVFGGFGTAVPIGVIGIALAFGIAYTAAAAAVGAYSGAHLNPAVTIGAWLADRFPAEDVVPYIVAQVVGAIIAAGALLCVLSSLNPYDAASGLGQTAWNANVSPAAIFAVEAVATFIFVTVILNSGSSASSGLLVGLTLAAIHLAIFAVSGASVNPARSIGPAVFVGGDAISQIWLYIIAPIVGGGVAGLAAKADWLNFNASSRGGGKRRKKR
jgi:aquaporin Z